MPHHNILSESEQMYLVTIRKICETCTDTSIPIPDLAEALSVLPVSVNQMVKKLAEAGLVEYVPYKGVELTPEGQAISTKILRHRRLWEVFLVKDLKMTLEEANTLTCRLEHITTEDVAQRLSIFLGDPAVCFHGSPIYPGDGSKLNSETPLTKMKIGGSNQVVRIEADEILETFLAGEGIHPGVQISVIASSNTGTMLVKAGNNSQVRITAPVAEKIFVEVSQ